MNTNMTLEKRILSVLLTVIVVFSMVPLSVFAADSNQASVTVNETVTEYATIQEAFDAAKKLTDPCTVKVLQSFKGSMVLGVTFTAEDNCDITLDVNGFDMYNCNTRDQASASMFTFEKGTNAHLTVVNNSENRETLGGIFYYPNGTDISNSVFHMEGGTLTIEDVGGDGIKNKTSNYDKISGSIVYLDGGDVIINGSKFGEENNIVPLYVKSGNLTVNGGTFITQQGNALRIAEGFDGKVNLSGGKFSSTFTSSDLDKMGNFVQVYSIPSILREDGGKVDDLLAKGYVYQKNADDEKNSESALYREISVVPEPGVKYIAADGTEQSCTEYSELTESTNGSAGLTGWYVVKGTVNKEGLIGIAGGKTLNLILCDGATVNLQSILYLMGGSTLNIYGQSGGTGTLAAKSSNYNPAIGLAYNTNAYNCTVNIYGGTVIAQSDGGEGAQAIGLNPRIMTGKVNVTIAKGLKCVKTDDLNTAYAYDNTDGTSITITKCTEHKWSYTNITNDTHDRTCDLCGTAETGVAHTTARYQYIRADIHRLICACGKGYSTEYHTYTYAPNSDGLTHTATCKCEYSVDDIAHTYKGEDEICICGAVHSATYDGKKYASLQSAIDAAAPVGGTVTLARQVNENVVSTDGTVIIDLGGNRWSGYIDDWGSIVPLTVNGGSVTLKNGNLFQWWSSSSARTGIEINDGSVTIEEDVRVMGGVPGRDVLCPSITLNGGTLILKEGAVLLTGLQVPDGKVLADYLPEGTAFVKCSYDNKSNTVTVSDPQEFVPDVYTANKITEGMMIVSHTHDLGGGTACPCGFNCDHSVVDSATGKCENCGTQIYVASLVKADGTAENYDIFANAWTAAIDNEGSTLKLLCDITLDKAEDGIIVQSGKFTLDLNGKTVSGEITHQLLTVSGAANITIRDGKLINTFNKDQSNINQTCASTLEIDGGTVTLDRVELIAGHGFKGARSYAAYIFSGSLTVVDGTFTGALAVGDMWGAHPSVKITSATLHDGIIYGYFGTTDFNYAGLKALFADGSMLFDKDGKYIDVENEAYWQIAGEGEDVSVVFVYGEECVIKPHTHNSYVDGKCSQCYCDLAAAIVKDGKTSGYVTFADALAAAQTDANKGCTLKLLADVNEKVAVKTGEFTLDATDRKINGALNVAKGAGLTVGGGETTGNVICAKGGKLTAFGTHFAGTINCVGEGNLRNCKLAGAVTGKSSLKLNSCEITGNLSISGNAEAEKCTVRGTVTVNNGGSLKSTGGTYKNTVNVKSGGTLEIISGTFDKKLTAESGSKLIVSGGSYAEVGAENNVDFTLSGGEFTNITVNGQHLIDCLAEGKAFEDMNNGFIIDGRVGIAGNVKVVDHTHTCVWKTSTHEKLCGCGYVEAVDTEAPVISGIDPENNHYGSLEFSVTDANDFTVWMDDEEITLVNGKYTMEPDNETHLITATDVAGNTVSFWFGLFKIYNVTLPTGAGYIIHSRESTVRHGDSYDFIVEFNNGYSRTEDFKVLVNGNKLDEWDSDANSASFAIRNVSENLVITVEGVADITAPEVEVSICGNSFKEFLNRITFGLFFKQTQTVEVKAHDFGSGIRKVEYLLSETAFADKDAITGNWTELTLNDDRKAYFSIEPNQKAFVYVRVTDQSGNIAVVNTEGVVVYTDSEAVTDAQTFTMDSGSNVLYGLKLNGNALLAVYNGTKEIRSVTDYSLIENGANAVLMLKNSYLRTLAAGEYTIRLTIKPMGENYADNYGNDAPADVVLKLTVEKKAPTLDHKESDGKIYDGKRIGMPTVNSDSDGVRIFEYKKLGEDDAAYTTEAPKNVGKYTIRITTAETDTFKAASSTMEFEIQPKDVTISDTLVSDKEYNGNTDASIASVGTVKGLADGDDVTIAVGKATFADKNVGANKTVTFHEFALSGDDAANYVLSAQPASTTASISARELTISDLKVKNKQYDGKNDAEIEGTPTLVGVVDGDVLTLVNGVPTFDSVKIGKNIAISFTAFTLSGDSMTVDNYTLTQPSGITANIVEYAADGITKDNVKREDKEALEKAEKALEGALRDFDGNYTDKEQDDLETKLETVKAALAAIGNAEKAAEEIGKLPSADDAKLSDKSALDQVKKLLEGLTENEKAMLSKDALDKVDALAEKIQKLAEEANSPKTGDTSNLALWIALLFISGGIVTGTTVVSKKKKRSVK